MRIDAAHRRRRAHLDAERAQIVRRAAGELFGERRQDAGPCLDQQDARARGIDPAEVAHQHRPADVGDGSGELDARRPSADDHEREEPPLRGSIGLVLRRLEGEEDAPADLRGLLERLQSRGELLPFRMPEVTVLGSAGEDQEVPGKLRPVFQRDLSLREIDRGGASQSHAHVRGPGELRAHRHGDVRRVQARRGHLIQQRLEEVMISLIDDGDLRRRVPRERPRRLQAAETGADHDHFFRHPLPPLLHSS